MYETAKDFLRKGALVVAVGKLELRDEAATPRIIVDELLPLESAYDRIKTLHLRLDAQSDPSILDRIVTLGQGATTTVAFIVTILHEGETHARYHIPRFPIRLDSSTIVQLQQLVGANNLTLSANEV